jgi:DHA3 family macrolide efflux protein-like MFS transporter
MVAASLMMIATLEVLFFIDVITAIIAVCILYFLVKVPHTERKSVNTERTLIFAELINGLRYIKRQKYLMWFFLLFGLFTVFMSSLCFLWHLQVTRNFGTDIWRLSANEIANAGGMILGGVLVGIWSFRNKMYSIGMASVITGIMTVLFGVWTNFIPYLVCMAILGVVTPYFMAPSMTLIQEKVLPDYLGRVLSVFTMLGSVIMPLGMLFFGPLADIININYIFIGTGAVMVFLGTLYFVSKTLRVAGIKNGNEDI